MIIRIIITSILSLALSGCGTYRSSFNCGDSKGAYCASMDRVDQMISSGEIERFNEQRQKKRYKAHKDSNELMPRLKPQTANITNYQVDDADY